jgi:hypothetical protein
VKEFQVKNGLSNQETIDSFKNVEEGEKNGGGVSAPTAATDGTKAVTLLSGDELMQTDAETDADMRKLMTAATADKAKIPAKCNTGGTEFVLWSKRWTLGSFTFLVFTGCTITIAILAELGIKVGYNLAPCGGIFDMSIYASAAAIPYGIVAIHGSVEINLWILKAGVKLELPIISVDLPCTASVGAKLQALGDIKGNVLLQLKINPWVFRILLFIEINFFFFKIKFEFCILELKIKGFVFNLLFLEFSKHGVKVKGPSFEGRLEKGRSMFKEGGGLTEHKGGKLNKKEPAGMVLSDDAPLLIGHKPSTLAETGTLSAQLASDDPFKGKKQDPLPSFSLGTNCKKCHSKKPNISLGRYADAPCTGDDQCKSGACVKTAKVKPSGRNLYICRPVNGFAIGHGCFYTRDCQTSNDEFCYQARTTKGVCSKKKKDYTPCEGNTQCISGTCAVSFGLACNVDDKNCLCRPKLGFKTGTKVASAWDCITKKATKKHKHSLPKCM